MGKLKCEFARVVTGCPTTCSPFAFDASEACMFDSIAEEHMGAVGTDIMYWHQNVSRSVRDPLYDEPIERAWDGPYQLKGFVEYMESQPQMKEEGLTIRWQGTIWIARAAVEAISAPVPLEGDVFRFWNNRFFNQHAVNQDTDAVTGPPASGYYFDVTNVDDEGHVFDTGYFVGLRIRVMRRTEFTPERRL